jgi:UDP-glucose 4-epimerase
MEPLAEDADRRLGPTTVARWAYSATKAVDEILAYSFHREGGLPSIVVRLFNTVGPRQRAASGMVIPRLVHQALRGEPLTVFGDGHQTRCSCHVADVVDALVRLMDHPDAVGEVFNVGSQAEISINELAHRILRRTPNLAGIQRVPYEQAYEPGFEDIRRRVPDTTKLRCLTFWSPVRRLDDLLEETIADAVREGVDQRHTGRGQ